MDGFYSEAQGIDEIKRGLENVQKLLDSAYQNAIKIKIEMTDSNNWTGKAQKTGEAFMHLTMQYHAKLKGTPLREAKEDLQKYLSVESQFYDTWEEYQKLKGL